MADGNDPMSRFGLPPLRPRVPPPPEPASPETPCTRCNGTGKEPKT